MTNQDKNQPKVKVATVWLDGCSGCHMSFLDMDERLADLAPLIDLVYSPLVDNKVFPDMVDVTLVEGAVSSEEDLHKIRHIRARTQYLIALGDCAINANVPSMRNTFGVKKITQHAYVTHATIPLKEKWDTSVVPPLLPTVRPVHAVVKVDCYVQGCPPSADVIYYVVSELLAGRQPDPHQMTRFGA